MEKKIDEVMSGLLLRLKKHLLFSQDSSVYIAIRGGLSEAYHMGRREAIESFNVRLEQLKKEEIEL